MGDAKQYDKEFAHLMEIPKERKDRAEHLKNKDAERYKDDLLLRAKAVGIMPSQVYKTVVADGGSFKGIEREIQRRKERRAAKKST